MQQMPSEMRKRRCWGTQGGQEGLLKSIGQDLSPEEQIQVRTGKDSRRGEERG